MKDFEPPGVVDPKMPENLDVDAISTTSVVSVTFSDLN
jgi:hypothetical protein